MPTYFDSKNVEFILDEIKWVCTSSWLILDRSKNLSKISLISLILNILPPHFHWEISYLFLRHFNYSLLNWSNKNTNMVISLFIVNASGELSLIFRTQVLFSISKHYYSKTGTKLVQICNTYLKCVYPKRCPCLLVNNVQWNRFTGWGHWVISEECKLILN